MPDYNQIDSHLLSGEKLIWQGSPQAYPGSRIFKVIAVAIFVAFFSIFGVGILLNIINYGFTFSDLVGLIVPLVFVGVMAVIFKTVRKTGMGKLSQVVYAVTNKRLMILDNNGLKTKAIGQVAAINMTTNNKGWTTLTFQFLNETNFTAQSVTVSFGNFVPSIQPFAFFNINEGSQVYSTIDDLSKGKYVESIRF